jgi:gustatory receptor
MVFSTVMFKSVLILNFSFSVEYVLSNADKMYISSRCSNGVFDFVRRYIMVTHRHVFGVIGYSTLMAIFTSVVSIISSFYWSYADMFIMLVSIALASRFQLLNYQLKQVKGKVSNNSTDNVSSKFCPLSYQLKDFKER